MSKTSEQRIIDAYEKLLAAGEKATVAAVRAELGGGSHSTINGVLRAYKATRQVDDEVIEPCPDPLQTSGVLLIQDVWKRALGVAQGRYHAERKKYEALVETLEQELRESLDSADSLTLLLSSHEQEINALRDKVAQIELDLGVSHQSRMQSQHRAEVAEASLSECRKRAEAAEKLAVELQGSRVA